MITLLTGKIGGGKTYWAVNYVAQKFFIYKPEIFQFVPRTDVILVTNIRDFELEHRNLDEEIKKFGLNGVFNQSYVSGKNVVFIIDEAQTLFHRKFYDKDIFSFFQMSRHYGTDIILITQDVDSLSKELRALYEYEVRAIPRSQRLKNTFMYKYFSHDEVFKTQKITFDKQIGNLYKSQFRNETEKVPRVWGKFIILALVLFAASLFSVKMLINTYKNQGKQEKAKLMTEQEVKKELEKTPQITPHTTPIQQSEHKGVNRLWSGSDTLETVYDEKNDTSFYILKENGVSVGYVKVDGSPRNTGGLGCNMAPVVCKDQDTNSPVNAFCSGCGFKLAQAAPGERLSGESKGAGSVERSETNERKRILENRKAGKKTDA